MLKKRATSQIMANRWRYPHAEIYIFPPHTPPEKHSDVLLNSPGMHSVGDFYP